TCVADKIVSAPFAIVGSIGVIAQIPNFNKLLKKHDIEFEQMTAGEYKRTLTMFGENTDKAREKFKQELEETHDLFKDFIREPAIITAKVFTFAVFHCGQLDRQCNRLLKDFSSPQLAIPFIIRASETGY
ncbi:hypothetical protein JS84_24770, partial [Vibrio vulnificus]